MAHLPPVELDTPVTEVGEVVTQTGVVCEGEEGVGVSDGGHGTQPRLPPILVPRDEAEFGTEAESE